MSNLRGGMVDLLQLLNAPQPALRAALSEPVALRRLQKGEYLFHEGATAAAIYVVRGGSFKLYRTSEDGYEQVQCFAGRAELLGFDALGGGWNHCSARALEDSSAYLMLLPDLLALLQRVPAFHLVVLRAASAALSAASGIADVMSPVAAEVRMARFLLHLSRNMGDGARSPHHLLLRMSRRDIASYLGVAHETVSRAMGLLAKSGLIRVANRKVELLDRDGLTAMSLGAHRDGAQVCGKASGKVSGDLGRDSRPGPMAGDMTAAPPQRVAQAHNQRHQHAHQFDSVAA